MGKLPYGIEPEMVGTVAQQVKDVIATGVEVCLVIGGGNIFRGMSGCLLYTSPSPRDLSTSRMPSSA